MYLRVNLFYSKVTFFFVSDQNIVDMNLTSSLKKNVFVSITSQRVLTKNLSSPHLLRLFMENVVNKVEETCVLAIYWKI